MRATVKSQLGCVALGLVVCGLPASAIAQRSGARTLGGIAAVGQSRLQTKKDERREAEELLRKAKASMDKGDYDLAQRYIEQAEQRDVQYDRLFSWFFDTPEKLRKELKKLRGQSATSPQPPSRRFRPTVADRSTNTQASDTSNPFLLRGSEKTLGSLTDNQKAAAKSYLQKGRDALEDGNIVGATGWYQKAAGLKADFAPGEYSPRQLADALRAVGVPASRLTPPRSVSSMPDPTRSFNFPRSVDLLPAIVRSPRADNNDANGPGMITNPYAVDAGTSPGENNFAQRSRFTDGDNNIHGGSGSAADPNRRVQDNGLMLEARRALAGRDARRAAELTSEANRLGLVSPLTGDSPRKFQALIEKHRELAVDPGRAAKTAAYRRSHAEFLMEQADGLLLYKDFEQARQLAQQAEQLGAEYGPFQRTPQRLREQIAAQLRAAGFDQNSQPVADLNLGFSQENFSSSVLQLSEWDSPANVGPPSVSPTGAAPAAVGGLSNNGPAAVRDSALALVARAQVAIDRGEIDQAERLAQQAQQLGVPDSAYAPGDPRPEFLFPKIDKVRRLRDSTVVPAVGIISDSEPSGAAPGQHRSPISLSGYESSGNGTTGKFRLTDELPATPDEPARFPNPGLRLFNQGERELERRDLNGALDYFQKAWVFKSQLDVPVRDRLENHLRVLGASVQKDRSDSKTPSPVKAASDRRQVLRQQMLSEVSQGLVTAERMRQTEPKVAMERLVKLRQRVAQSELDAIDRQRLSARLDRGVRQINRYIEDNRAQIDQDDKNRQVLEQVDRNRQMTREIQEELAKLVEQFNTLMAQERYKDAMFVAKKARELDPENPVVRTMVLKNNLVQRLQEYREIEELSEAGVVNALASVHDSKIPFDDRNPILFPETKFWKDMTASRSRQLRKNRVRYNEAERQIQSALKTKVDVRFPRRPLSEVIATLGDVAGINVHLDQQGLMAEGISSDAEVDIVLATPISLQSALNTILEPLDLSYVIQDEMLKITSIQMREAKVYTETYAVADLVIPIPNFVPNADMGLSGAIRRGYDDALGYSAMGGAIPRGALAFASTGTDDRNARLNATVLAQMGESGRIDGSGGGRPFGPGGLAGGTNPDFDSLIDLITSTVEPATWDEVGGPGTLRRFEPNLSLVISQTQEVHDQIADLLEQLRRLQDLQITIEIRFITLADNFFERIGIDFDFEIDDNVTSLPTGDSDSGPSVTVGFDRFTGSPTADLDLSFSQDSFASAVPVFGGFDAASAATFGFAVLSDIEAFFFLEALEGDSRSNVLNAPKVTLFNGQNAMVFDSTQTPFVTGITPVVGDFAAAHQPIIAVLSEGTQLSVQAVVSNDRRFVRLTVVPLFSRIGEVRTFTFSGKTTTNTGSTVVDPTDDSSTITNDADTVIEGTTVQQPSFSSVSVNSTVSVPDGGTILLGGIKRLSEGRTERGVPMLSKIPYINRLFRNVAIGRETSSLMLMVTPRIIIQEEEEANLLGTPP